jgi:hypothetical protein
MTMQKIEYEFPDPDKVKGKEPEIEIVLEEDEPEIAIEVAEDAPEEDRNRKASEPPEEATEEELKSYSTGVKKRIQHLTKGYHDERRAKEQAMRESQELERVASKLIAEVNNLKGTVGKNQSAMLDQAKRAVAGELDDAKRKYKLAYEAGDSDALVAAQEDLTMAKIRVDKVANIVLPSLQEEKTPVQTTTQPHQQGADPKAQGWASRNTWFGTDDEMTSFALGYHNKLVKEGVNPQSDDYYDKLNGRMREVFRDRFEDEKPQRNSPPPRAAKPNVVAPASRSIAPTKVVLTKTQVQLAKKLGLTLEVYARSVAAGNNEIGDLRNG